MKIEEEEEKILPDVFQPRMLWFLFSKNNKKLNDNLIVFKMFEQKICDNHFATLSFKSKSSSGSVT